MSRRIALQTHLGLALEELVARALARVAPEMVRSPSVEPGLIRPDFLRTGPRPALVAVTHTPSRNTFQKKKWRYVHELFSARRAWGPGLVAVSVQLSPTGALQAQDLRILEQLFDAVVRPEEAVLQEVLTLLREGWRPGRRARGAAARLSEAPAVEALVDQLALELERALASPPRHPDLDRLLVEAPHPRHCRARPLHTHLRAVCFGLVLVEDEALEPTLQLLVQGERLPRELMEPLVQAGAPIVPRLGGPAPDPDVFAQTLRHGFAPPVVASLVRRIRDSNEGAHVLEDLRQPQHLPSRVGRALDLLAHPTPDELGSACASDFEAAQSQGRRHVLLDDLLLVAGLSITETDRRLGQRYPDQGHANRVQCTISARCPLRRSFTSAQTRLLGERLWAMLREQTDALSQSVDQGVDRVLAGRRRTLKLLGVEANPVELLVAELLDRAGLTHRRVSRPCLLRDLGARGRGGSVERLVEVGHGTLLKVLSAYRGGVEHKAEELAGRAWALRLRLDEAGWRREELRLVLVYEGQWTEAALSTLAAAGWSDFVAAAELVGQSEARIRQRLVEGHESRC